MDVVFVIAEFFKFDVISFSNFLCQMVDGERNVFREESFAVLNGKGNVVVSRVCIVVCFLDGHPLSLSWKPRVSKPSYRAPAASRGEIRCAYYTIFFEKQKTIVSSPYP